MRANPKQTGPQRSSRVPLLCEQWRSASARANHCSQSSGTRAGFSLVELLVAIVVIGLLIVIIAGAANKAMELQRVRNTDVVLKNVSLAIDQFAKENPLRLRYDRKGSSKSYGPFPPYQLKNSPAGLPTLLGGFPGIGNTLEDRLREDLQMPDVEISSNNAQIRHHDNRALQIYLRALMPEALAQVPERYIHSLGAPDEGPDGEYVGSPQTRLPVHGFFDAWDVPLDYMLYVKVERGMDSGGTVRWRIVDRIPVLRSRGISKDEFAAGISDPARWRFSTPLPSPAAGVEPNGNFSGTSTDFNGWVRVVALDDDDYGYRPDQDQSRP